MTKLTVSIMVTSLEQALSATAVAAEQGADLVEFRIDQFTDRPPRITELVERSPLPCIVTCRHVSEGGLYDGDEQLRISLLEHAGLGTRQPVYIDLELEAYQRSANLRQKVGLVVDHPGQVRPTTTGLILSSHETTGRPRDLYQRIEAMTAAAACRAVKVAWTARSLRDNLEAFDVLKHRHKPTIALCMGEFGLPSRVLAKKFGALLTFASLDAAGATAPGQPTLEQIRRLYRWDRLGPLTAVFGVIGWPIGHSRSPAVHNAGFDETGFDGVMLPMPIPPEYEHFKATVISWLDFAPLHFRGAAVTAPHKENLLRFVRERNGVIDPLAERIGAANTLLRRDDGSLLATNTDHTGALEALCAGMSITREDLAGKRIAVLGAGGAARAVVAGLAHHGATVVVYNRTMDKATTLAKELGDLSGKVVAARMEKLCDSCCEVYINCTPVGMWPDVDATPMASPPSGSAVFDLVYNPARTRLIRESEAAGCTTIGGLEMFVRQAAAQFRMFTDKDAPEAIFRRVLSETLNEA